MTKTSEVSKVAIFKSKKIRRVIYQNEWWFSVVDVAEALTDSVNSRLLVQNENKSKK